MHRDDLPILESGPSVSMMYGVPFEGIVEPGGYLKAGDIYSFGTTKLEVRLAPGHSPGSICFYHRPSKQIIVGDVLFFGSIGRTDLPGGDYDTLLQSIQRELLVLPDETEFHPGHGPSGSIGHERLNNPFIVSYQSTR